MRLLLVSLFVVASASARVGETEPQLVTRYGPIVTRQPARKSAQGKMSIYGERLSFRSPDWNVNAVIIGGKCEEITYTKDGKWTPIQLRFLLELNGGARQWIEQPTKNPEHSREWRRRDHAKANWGPFAGFTVKTPAAEAAVAISDG